MAKQDAPDHDSKQDQLSAFHRSNDGGGLTTNQGIGIADNQNTLKSGIRGPQLLEDFVLREKITHFDHERIPERVVHARGAAAHGYFQVYDRWVTRCPARVSCRTPRRRRRCSCAFRPSQDFAAPPTPHVTYAASR